MNNTDFNKQASKNFVKCEHKIQCKIRNNLIEEYEKSAPYYDTKKFNSLPFLVIVHNHQPVPNVTSFTP